MELKQKIARYCWLTLEVLPVAVPAVVAVFGIVAMYFLLLGRFSLPLVLPIGSLAALVVIVLIARYYPRDIKLTDARNICNLLLIGGVVVWGVFNIFYTSQHVMTSRDPSEYANGGIWLVNHDNLNIPKTSVFGNVTDVHNDDGGAGFYSISDDSGHYQVQGLHLLDAFVGLVGRVTSIAGSLHVNVLFGMSALFGIYAFARGMIPRTWWAVLATFAVAASMPMMYFSRDMFTEPLTATFTFGGLALLWLALKTKKFALWYVAGLVIAASAMVRIDGYMSIIATAAFMAVMLLFARRRERWPRVKEVIALSLGLLTTGWLGWIDLTQLSRQYYHDQRSYVMAEMVCLLVVVLLGIILTFLSWKTEILSWLNSHTAKWRSVTAASLIFVFVLALISRPLWLTGTYNTGTYIHGAHNVMTTQWVSWYIGTGLAVLGVVGLAMAAYRIFKKLDLFLVASLSVIAVSAVVYMINPKVSLDQIWAARRLLPVILPAVAVFGALAIDWLWTRFSPRLRSRYVFAALASIALILSPLATSRPVLSLRSFAELSAMNDICDALPANAAVLYVGRARQLLIQPTRGVCGVPSEGYGKLIDYSPSNDLPPRATLAMLAKNSSHSGKLPVIGVMEDKFDYLQGGGAKGVSKVADVQDYFLERTFTQPPRTQMVSNYIIQMGVIQPDGSVVALSKLAAGS